MDLILVIIFSIILLALFVENYKNKKNRSKLKYVIHVNGIRGKSTVTRLIHAGLLEGGYRAYAKTTGTIPMIINTENEEVLIERKGRANIKEQIKIMSDAASQDAEVLVIECMAVNPRLQNVSEHSILKSNISVITNVRLDHTEEMGYSYREICESLSNTIPKKGFLVTSENKYFEDLKKYSKEKDTKIIKTTKKTEYSKINFEENVACAVEVCKLLGIKESTALKGMEKFKNDPYDLKLYKLSSGAIFINGLSINDPDSSEIVYKMLKEKYIWKDKNLIVLINNRPDRGYRAEHMVKVSKKLKPKKIILMGSFKYYLKKELSEFNIILADEVKDIDLDMFNEKDIIFAIGNIANHGDKILDYVEKDGAEYV